MLGACEKVPSTEGYLEDSLATVARSSHTRLDLEPYATHRA
jgi:hypothetical protein